MQEERGKPREGEREKREGGGKRIYQPPTVEKSRRRRVLCEVGVATQEQYEFWSKTRTKKRRSFLLSCCLWLPSFILGGQADQILSGTRHLHYFQTLPRAKISN